MKGSEPTKGQRHRNQSWGNENVLLLERLLGGQCSSVSSKGVRRLERGQVIVT